MTDAYTDLSSLNKTYREMVEGCGCDKGKAKDNKKPTKPNIKESLSATCLFTEEELDNIIEKMTAFDMVKKSLSDKGALMDSSKMKRRGITPEEHPVVLKTMQITIRIMIPISLVQESQTDVK